MRVGVVMRRTVVQGEIIHGKMSRGQKSIRQLPWGEFHEAQFYGGSGGGLIVQRGLVRGNCPRGKYLGASRPKGDLHRG